MTDEEVGDRLDQPEPHDLVGDHRHRTLLEERLVAEGLEAEVVARIKGGHGRLIASDDALHQLLDVGVGLDFFP